MPRIEQLPNGAYVKKADTMEEQIIKRLYKEIADRKAENSALTIRLESAENTLVTALAEINNLKLRLQAVEGSTS